MASVIGCLRFAVPLVYQGPIPNQQEVGSVADKHVNAGGTFRRLREPCGDDAVECHFPIPEGFADETTIGVINHSP